MKSIGKQLHELDRAWEALDVLPASTVDDGFARTTIELACVAAEADLTEHTAAAKAAKRNRMWRWIAAGVAAGVFGFLAGRALIPHRNGELLADLPAIQQHNVLAVRRGRRILAAACRPRCRRSNSIKDEPTFDRNLKELESANSPSLETRREWIQSLPPERKAELADRTRAFDDLEPASEEREHMRQVMDDIREAKDAANLQKTLVAYGQWLSRHTRRPTGTTARTIPRPAGRRASGGRAKTIEQDERASLPPPDAGRCGKASPGNHSNRDRKNEPRFMERMRKSIARACATTSTSNVHGKRPMFALADLFRRRQARRKRQSGSIEQIESRSAQAHWKSLDRVSDLQTRQLVDLDSRCDEPESRSGRVGTFLRQRDKLTPDQRQQLLDMPRAEHGSRIEAHVLQLGTGN